MLNYRLRAFKNLEELFVFNTQWGNITEGMLRQLLSGPKLRYKAGSGVYLLSPGFSSKM